MFTPNNVKKMIIIIRITYITPRYDFAGFTIKNHVYYECAFPDFPIGDIFCHKITYHYIPATTSSTCCKYMYMLYSYIHGTYIHTINIPIINLYANAYMYGRNTISRGNGCACIHARGSSPPPPAPWDRQTY